MGIRNDLVDICNGFVDIRSGFVDVRNDFVDIRNDFVDKPNNFVDIRIELVAFASKSGAIGRLFLVVNYFFNFTPRRIQTRIRHI